MDDGRTKMALTVLTSALPNPRIAPGCIFNIELS